MCKSSPNVPAGTLPSIENVRSVPAGTFLLNQDKGDQLSVPVGTLTRGHSEDKGEGGSMTLRGDVLGCSCRNTRSVGRASASGILYPREGTRGEHIRGSVPAGTFAADDHCFTNNWCKT